jgi:hypothetical protein
MAQIYGELIRAQLQSSASDLTPTAPGLVYFNTTTGLKWYTGSAWKVAVDLDSTQSLANKTIDATCSITAGALPITTLAKGGLGADASAWSGFVKIAAGSASAVSLGLSDLPLITPSKGGTGVANDDAATLTRSGNHAVTLTTTATTSLTLPTTGTLATTADITMANLTGTLVPSKGGTGVANNDAATLTRSGNHAVTLTTTGTTGVTLPTTGTLATLAGTESLSAKTLVEPVIDNFAALNHETTPFAAAAGTVRVYAKSDNKLYKMDSTGAEAAVGSGSGSGGVNYLVDWYDATKPVGTVSTVAANGNIVVSGSAPAVTSAWYADATSGAAAIASSTSTLLRGSSNYLTALSGASTSGATFVQSAVFNIDGSDLGKPVTISFDVSGVTTLDDWDVIVARYTVSSTTGTYAELIPVAGTASSTTGTPGAQLPTGTTQFKGFFIPSATSTDVYALRLRRRSGATQIRVDSLTVGPQSLAQGAVVTGWQSYTPTFSNLVGGANTSFKYRRVGQNVEINGRFQTTTASPSTSTLAIGLPSGLTIDSSAISDFALLNQYGTVSLYIFSTGLTQTNKFSVSLESGTGGTAAFVLTQSAGVARVRESDLGQNNYVEVSATIPISQWSSGTTTLADRAVEEFFYNTSATWDADDATTSNFGYGVQGATIGGALSASRVKRCRSQSPILPTDKLVVEFSDDRIIWKEAPFGGVTAGIIQPLTYDGTNYVGGGAIENISGSGTDIYVRFGRYRLGSLLAANWNGGYWRVKKTSGGGVVGFPVSARNIVGDTSGTVVPTGMIGEIISSKTSAATNVTTAVYFDAVTITLTSSGTYRLDSSVRYSLNGATVTIWQGELFFGTTTGNNSTGFDLNENYWNVPSACTSAADCSINATQVINYNSTTGVVTFSSGATMTLTGGVLRLKSRPGGFTGGPILHRSFLTATRIA